MGRIVIACYRPKPGKEEALAALILDHVATLRGQGLVTDRVPITAVAGDGTIVEVFEWASSAAIESAHANPAILKMWDQYAEVCDYVPVAEVPEAANVLGVDPDRRRPPHFAGQGHSPTTQTREQARDQGLPAPTSGVLRKAPSTKSEPRSRAKG